MTPNPPLAGVSELFLRKLWQNIPPPPADFLLIIHVSDILPSWSDQKSLQYRNLMNNMETILRRREAEFKTGQKDLARELSQTLVLLPHRGNCKCGMMLTEQDRNPKMKTYRCPRCGKSDTLTSLAAIPRNKG